MHNRALLVEPVKRRIYQSDGVMGYSYRVPA